MYKGGEDLLLLEKQICFAVYACAREITGLYRPYLDELGLTYTQYITMLVLWEQDHISVKELGKRLYLDSGTLTPLLKKLEARGIVTRVRDKKDERSVLVQVTEQGRELKQKVSEIPRQVFCRTGMSVEEAAELQKKLMEVVKKVNEIKMGEC
jgi:DNA-binding MarR family transcriptional regulator